MKACIVLCICFIGTHDLMGCDAPENSPVFKGKPLRSWLRDLADLENCSRQSKAAEAVQQFCSEIDGAIPAILKTLNDKDDSVRWGAMRALRGCRERARIGVPAIAK